MIGYGTQSRELLTTSVSKVDNKVLESVPYGNLASALQGSVSGVRVQSTSGQPGEAPRIVVRGGTSIQNPDGAAPLYVVDGVPYEGSLDAINPSEIANITILKDATAASIYGSRSANGVIVIMTKKGAGKSTIEYNGSVVITPLRDDRDYLNLMNSEELVDWQVEMFNTYHSPYSSSDKRYYQNEVLNLLYENEAGNISDDEMNRQLNIYRNRNNYNELKDNFLRTAITHQHNLALRGSSDRYQYSASVNYMQNIFANEGAG